MERFEHKGVTLEYEVTGEGRPFVFLHGLGGGIHQIRSTYEPIEGVMLINMNGQGHGESGADWESLDFDRMGEDVLALLDHLGIEKAVFSGISMGAAVSLNIASRFPERVEKLILIRNAWLAGPMTEDRVLAYRQLGECLRDSNLDAFMKSAAWRIVREPSDYTRKAFLLPFKESFNIRNWQKFVILPGKKPIPEEEALSKVTMPVHILACRGDYCHPFGYGIWLSEKLPGSRFTEIPNKDQDSVRHKAMINEVLRKELLSE